MVSTTFMTHEDAFFVPFLSVGLLGHNLSGKALGDYDEDVWMFRILIALEADDQELLDTMIFHGIKKTPIVCLPLVMIAASQISV